MAVRTPVYLDNHATTPMDPAVLEVLQRVQKDHFGNPASEGHSFGWAAQTLVKNARHQVAQLLGADPREIIFTSGATEANNLALLGIAAASTKPGKIISSTLEHSSVSEPLDHLEQRGWDVVRVPSDQDGLLQLEVLEKNLGSVHDHQVSLVSVIAAQNEIGTLQPLEKIGKLCRDRGVLFHSDAAQACGHVAMDVTSMGLDLVSISSHKIYGPKGVGALMVKRTHPPLPLQPLSFGGGQENGLRPGTLNVPGIAAFGEACRLALENRDQEVARIRQLRDRLWHRLEEQLPGVDLNGSAHSRLPGNLNIRFDGIRSAQLLPRVAVLALSTGSACRSAEPGPSPVLLSLGLTAQQAAASVRIGLGRFTTEEEVDFAAERLVAAVVKLRQEKP